MYVGPLSDTQRQRLESGLRSRDAFELRRCQILLASARGERPSQIAAPVGCTAQTVRNVLRAARAKRAGCLRARSSRPKQVASLLEAARCEQLRAILPESPRAFGKPPSLGTLALLAKVCSEQGLTPGVVSIESIRRARQRMRVSWKRAKHWITSPDPDTPQKKSNAIG
ncbi:MAG TPA: helix-turn-helix domain-containing protein [Candidatus Competibacteraceae bacterium]|nr:helix-turn-helix domain-containing protein [Candidatus Competibacteraceae bacterium]